MIKHGVAPYLECSSRGERRLSAFYAMVEGASIEMRYQSAKVFEGGETNLHWRKAKGRKPVNQIECSRIYSELWDQYMKEHPDLLRKIREASGLSDRFGQQGHCCQATELWRIRNDLENFP